MKTPKTYDEYCLDFPEETQRILENLKNFIQNLLPESELCINYGIPTFKMKGKNVIHLVVSKIISACILAQKP